METVMERCQRVDPPFASDEKTMLSAFLDWQRATLICKLDGLTDEEVRRPGTSSGVCLLGLIKHQTSVEAGWFRSRFAGQTLEHPWDPDDPDGDYRIEPDETTAGLIAAYRAELARSRAIVAAANLDDLAKNPAAWTPDLTLRWIMLHMLEEVARHVGHADILREAIDGQVGE